MTRIYTTAEVREMIAQTYVRDGLMHRLFGHTSYREFENIEPAKYPDKPLANKLTIYKSKTPFVLLLLISAFFLFTFPIFYTGNPTPFSLKIMYGLCLFLILVGIYKVFLVKEVFIQMNPNSFKMKNKKAIFWDEILITGIWYIHGKNRHQFLILGLNNGEILKLDIERSEISCEDFIRIIHLKKFENEPFSN